MRKDLSYVKKPRCWVKLSREIKTRLAVFGANLPKSYIQKLVSKFINRHSKIIWNQ